MGNSDANLETARLLRPYERALIRNAWYCAGWADELKEGLLARRIVDIPVVMFRDTQGKAVALLDICPHKLAPLSLGVRAGNNVQCGYHGLEFDGTGRCVKNPQGDGRLPNAQVRTFQLVERYGVLWIWTGQPELADDSKIMNCSHLDDPAWRTVKGGHHVNANYMLLVENLLDLGHALFLHSQSGGFNHMALSENKIEQERDRIHDFRLYREVPVPGSFRAYPPGETKVVDYHSDIHWVAPSMLTAENGCSLPGKPRDPSGTRVIAAHLVTPETQHTMHYFYGHSRNFGHGDKALDQSYRRWQHDALHLEDSRVAEAIDGALNEIARNGVRMVSLSTDASGIRANRILDSLAADDG